MQQLSARKVFIMRSEIALASLLTKNRFALCHQVFKIVRKLHKPGNRIQDTATDALQRLAGAEQQRGEAKIPNAIETQPEQIAIAS
jgi:vacuolar-type H+-ATPase subunit D/Vma8